MNLDRIAMRLLEVAVGSERFSSVMGVEESRRRLAGECAEPSCFEAMAVALDANVVVLGELSGSSSRVGMTLTAYTRYAGEVQRVEVPFRRRPRWSARWAGRSRG